MKAINKAEMLEKIKAVVIFNHVAIDDIHACTIDTKKAKRKSVLPFWSW